MDKYWPVFRWNRKQETVFENFFGSGWICVCKQWLSVNRRGFTDCELLVCTIERHFTLTTARIQFQRNLFVINPFVSKGDYSEPTFSGILQMTLITRKSFALINNTKVTDAVL